MILGVYFAMNSGTVDSVVYDTVIEETGSPDLYERWIGRVRIVESAAFTTSALAGGLLAGWTSPRLTYFLTIPFVLASIIAFSRFREPGLHRAAEPLALRRHVATTAHAMTRIPSVRRMLLLAALTALLSQAVFEFGPLWLVALHAPAATFGPYWAVLVATLGAGGYVAPRLHLGDGSTALIVAAILAATPILLTTSHSVIVVAAAQTVLALTLAVTGIHAGRLLHDAVPSHIRAGVSSGAGTLSWMLFLPFSLGFGALARANGVYTAGWIFVGTCAALAVLLVLSTRAARNTPAEIQALNDTTVDESNHTRPPMTPPPADLACRDLVRLVSNYLDGDLPPDWRASIDDHLTVCDGCTTYLEQIRQTIALLEHIETNQRPPTPATAVGNAQQTDTEGGGPP
jgi:hypothetical protein